MDLLIEKAKGQELAQVIVGTYEEYLIGFSLNYDEETNKLKFYQKFTNHAHNGSVKAIACSNNGLLVSGATDETCFLINLRKSQEIGNLIEHEGAITELQFYKNKFLMSSSEDNTILVWNMSTVNCDKKLKGHKQAVNSISVHPTGKLMLSVGRDKTVRTWNLIQGRLAFVTNLKESANLVRWSPNGQHFLLAYNKRIDIYDIQTCGIVNSIEIDAGIGCVQYAHEQDCLIVGKENGELSYYNSLSKDKAIYSFKAHDRRVKDFCILPVDQIKLCSNALCTISSDGLLKLWNVNLAKQQHELITEHNINCRLNCITFYCKPQ